MLRRGNANPDVANWVRKHFRCEECEANQRPKARRPAAVPRTYRFNHVVGIDLVEIKDINNDRKFWLNVICWGSAYQQVYSLLTDGRKTPENVFHTFVETWVRIFGMPEMIILDPGTEFQGYFATLCQS